MAQPYQNPSPVPGANSSNSGPGFGYLQTGQLGSDQWGTGGSFQGAANQAGLDAIHGGMSTANPLDYAGQDQMRSYLTNYMANLPGQPGSSFDSHANQGIANLGAVANGQGNPGGAAGYGGSYGTSQNQMNNNQVSAMIKAKADALSEANGAQNGLSNIMNNNLSERKFQFGQGQSLADQINHILGNDQNKTMQQMEMQNKADINKQNMWVGLAGAGAKAGAGMYGGGTSYEDPYAGTPDAGQLNSDWWNQ